MSKNALVFMLLVNALSLTSVAQTAAQERAATGNTPINVVLADGTPVKLRLGNTAASSDARVGEDLELEVTEDVRVADVVVLAKGNVANAEVTGLHAGAGNAGRIDISLRSVTLSDGQVVSVRSTKDQPNRGDQAMIVSSSSRDASIAPGSSVTAFINGNQPLDLIRLRASGVPTQPLRITSTPANADVSVDGHLNGTTPYVFHVSSGDHIVSVRLAGYQPSQRTVRVSTEPVALEVPLAKQDGTEPVPTHKSSEPSLGDLARAARARKAQQNPPGASNQSGQGQPNSRASQRDPMEPPVPKQ